MQLKEFRMRLLKDFRMLILKEERLESSDTNKFSIFLELLEQLGEKGRCWSIKLQVPRSKAQGGASASCHKREFINSSGQCGAFWGGPARGA